MRSPFKREKELIELQSGVLVEKFDIEKDCAWCGQRLTKGTGYFSEYYEYDEKYRRLNPKIVASTIDERPVKLIGFNFHRRCANEKHGKEVAIGPD